MTLDHASVSGDETPKEKPTKPSSTANFDTINDVKKQNAKLEAGEQHTSSLGNLVMDHWDGNTDPAQCFGITVAPSLIPDEVVDCLRVIEADYELDLAQSLLVGDLDPADIGDMLTSELETRAVEKDVDDAKANLVVYKDKVENLRASGKSNVEIILALENDPVVPEGECAKLQAFASIMRVSAKVPADQVIIKERINQINAADGFPDPVMFVRAFVFENPNSQIKTGISNATQDSIAAELGIVRHAFSAKTGGDINDIYQKGVGTKRVRDPETGELREERMYLRPGEDVEIRDNQFVGLSDANRPIMKIIGEHPYTSDLPEHPTDHDMTMYGLTTQWIAKLNDVNMAEIFFPHSVMERGGGHINLNMPDDFNRAQQLCQIFFGAMAGYNGELLDQSDLDRIPYLMQFQNQKGDAVIGDVNPEQMKADYQRQGIIGKDGQLDWKRFGDMVAANRNGLFFNEENYGLEAHTAPA